MEINILPFCRRKTPNMLANWIKHIDILKYLSKFIFILGISVAVIGGTCERCCCNQRHHQHKSCHDRAASPMATESTLAPAITGECVAPIDPMTRNIALGLMIYSQDDQQQDTLIRDFYASGKNIPSYGKLLKINCAKKC